MFRSLLSLTLLCFFVSFGVSQDVVALSKNDEAIIVKLEMQMDRLSDHLNSFLDEDEDSGTFFRSVDLLNFLQKEFTTFHALFQRLSGEGKEEICFNIEGRMAAVRKSLDQNISLPKARKRKIVKSLSRIYSHGYQELCVKSTH